MVQGVLSVPEHSWPKLAYTIVVPGDWALRTAVSTGPRAEVEMTPRKGESTRTGGTTHGPATPIPSPVLSNVTVSVEPACTHTGVCGPLREADTATEPDWQSGGTGPVVEGTLVVDGTIVVDVLLVGTVVVGRMVVGAPFWLEALDRTMATGVVIAANRRRLPVATPTRR
jgi:hypothetical protein